MESFPWKNFHTNMEYAPMDQKYSGMPDNDFAYLIGPYRQFLTSQLPDDYSNTA